MQSYQDLQSIQRTIVDALHWLLQMAKQLAKFFGAVEVRSSVNSFNLYEGLRQ